MVFQDPACPRCHSQALYTCYRGLHCSSCDYCSGDPLPKVGPDSPVYYLTLDEWPYEGLTDPHMD